MDVMMVVFVLIYIYSTNFHVLYRRDARYQCHSFSKVTCYHTILEFGSVRWYLHYLPSEIRGAKFHNINIVCNSIGQDLIKALAFYKSSATILCEALKMPFKNNHIMDTIKVLEPTNMPTQQVGLTCWGVHCAYYRVPQEFHDKQKLPPSIHQRQ